MCAWITNTLQECYKVSKNAEKARGCRLFRENGVKGHGYAVYGM